MIKLKKVRKLFFKPVQFFKDYRKNKIIANENFISLAEPKQFSIKSLFRKNAYFYYKNEMYISAQKLVDVLFKLKYEKRTRIRIVCDNSVCFNYEYSQGLNKNNLLQKLQSKNMIYLEIQTQDGKLFSMYCVITKKQESNFVSHGEVRSINTQNLNLIRNNNYFNKFKYDVDVVYTYVDSNDNLWKDLWIKTFGINTYDPDRYASHDELKYSLRSINMYAPWVHNIFIVSNCAKPKWLDTNSKVKWIFHSDIFPSKNSLPTFNSHAIESCLHLIPNLSEHFIYFNDDVFLNRTMYKDDFFTEFGKTINFREPYCMGFWQNKTLDKSESIGYKHAVINSQRLLFENYNYVPRYLMQHCPFPMMRSVAKELEKKFKLNYKITRNNKSRSKNDINVTSFLYPHYAFITNNSIHKSARYSIIRPTNYKKVIQENYKYTFLCLNSFLEDDNEFITEINNLFQQRYYIKANWEI